MQDSTPTFSDYVTMSVDAGIAPLELRFIPIVRPGSGDIIAYRTRTLIHSIILGELSPEVYSSVSDRREVGILLLRHALQHAITALSAFDRAGRKVQFLSVRCPAELVETADLYGEISAVLQKNPTVDPQRLCLEFPASLMDQQTQKARTAILDMKLLKLRTALVGCGAEEFPVAKLLTVSPDIVFLDPSATAFAGSRNKPQLLSALVSLVMSMHIDAIAEGTKAQRDAMRGTDCIGFLHTDGKCLSLDEALAWEGDA